MGYRTRQLQVVHNVMLPVTSVTSFSALKF